MLASRKFAISVTILSSMWLLSGCNESNGTTNIPDGATFVPATCFPGKIECLTDRVLAVCTSDGRAWVSAPCDAGDKCVNGLCVGPVCQPGQVSCMAGSPERILRCAMDGQAYETTDCPSGTKCDAQGYCYGTCIVGSSMCESTGAVLTCVDGRNYQRTSCAQATACVATGSSPFETAKCQPAECKPTAEGCDRVCGNQIDGNANQTDSVSVCVATPDGYKWSTYPCQSPATCDPAGAACGTGSGRQAACQVECEPGSTRCVTFGEIQTCDQTGKWAGVQPCGVNSCLPAGGARPKAVCGNPVCLLGKGQCDGTSLKACNAIGQLDEARACAAGSTCISYSAPLLVEHKESEGPLSDNTLISIGVCTSLCKVGERRCVVVQGDGETTVSRTSTQFQVCQADGLWGPQVDCPATDMGGVSCHDFHSTVDGNRDILCNAACSPGATACSEGGTVTCTAQGKWGPKSACAVGQCACFVTGALPGVPPINVLFVVPDDKLSVCEEVIKLKGGGGEAVDVLGAQAHAACMVECEPGAPVCIGKSTSNYPARYPELGICDKGVKPKTGSACAQDKFCMVGTDGKVLGGGCIECAAKNSLGLRDARCTAFSSDVDLGTTTSTSLQQCGDDFKWQSVQACTSDTTCVEGTTDVPLPPVQGAYCHTFGWFNQGVNNNNNNGGNDGGNGDNFNPLSLIPSDLVVNRTNVQAAVAALLLFDGTIKGIFAVEAIVDVICGPGIACPGADGILYSDCCTGLFLGDKGQGNDMVNHKSACVADPMPTPATCVQSTQSK